MPAYGNRWLAGLACGSPVNRRNPHDRFSFRAAATPAGSAESRSPDSRALMGAVGTPILATVVPGQQFVGAPAPIMWSIPCPRYT
jgi:hypothetical protein